MAQSDIALYRCDQIRLCEQQAKVQYQLDDLSLMLQAGTDAFFFITRYYPQIKNIAIYCGSGNNAGDGYVLAKLAQENGLKVVVYQAKTHDLLPDAAKYWANLAINSGVECQLADEPLDSDVELIVDALLGIGIKGPVYGLIAAAIHQINTSGLPVVSLDIPSGLNADTGLVTNFCVKANITLTFIAPKTGLYTLDGPDYCGDIHCRHLQLETCLAQLTPKASLLTTKTLPLPLKARKKNSHKGNYGHVLIIGGGPGMPGAVSLCAKAALRIGAGAVTVATWKNHAFGPLVIAPEAMVWGIEEASELEPLLNRASVCVIGPGLGESQWAQELFLTAMKSMLPMVIDADALRLLAKNPQVDDNWILTPHPGEAASLLSCNVEEVQQDRYEAITSLQALYGGVIVLKGNGTLIKDLENTFVCTKGNPGMASAGMGDALCGIIAGLCAQGLSLSEAAKLGVFVHAIAGDRVAKTQGERGLLASDLLDVLPGVLNEL